MQTFTEFTGKKLNEALDDEFKSALATYFEKINKSFEDFQSDKTSDYAKQSIANFKEKLIYKVSQKYVKVIKDGSVHSFIVKEDDGKFKKGDILMPASFNAPAKNKARGNIFGQYTIGWTGPNYLK